jgi:hypothetical protein
MREDEIDFSIDTTPFKAGNNWVTATLSKTLIAFHGVLIMAIVVVIIVLTKKG